MLNAEKYKNEIESKNYRFGISDHITDCESKDCTTCIFSSQNNIGEGLKNTCTVRKVKWCYEVR